MKIKEYNEEFLPKINKADHLIRNLDNLINFAFDDDITNKDELKKSLLNIMGVHFWSEETQEIILKALEYYRIHEGIEKLE